MLTLITALLSAVGELMDKLPNFEQRKKEKYFELKQELYDELNKPSYKRNHGRISELMDDIVQFMEAFGQDIKS